MKFDRPLHVRFKNADSPVDAYRVADPWTPEMQRELQNAFEQPDMAADLLSRITPRFLYHCPTCEKLQEEISFEAVTFYADDDLDHWHPLGQGQLISLSNCGHRFRLEFAA